MGCRLVIRNGEFDDMVMGARLQGILGDLLGSENAVKFSRLARHIEELHLIML
jgi:hypothetical protein